jgi:hypothetical protein
MSPIGGKLTDQYALVLYLTGRILFLRFTVGSASPAQLVATAVTLALYRSPETCGSRRAPAACPAWPAAGDPQRGTRPAERAVAADQLSQGSIPAVGRIGATLEPA